MKNRLLRTGLIVFGVAEVVAVLALAWLKPSLISEMILVALAVWLALFNFARIAREKRAVPVKVGIKR